MNDIYGNNFQTQIPLDLMRTLEPASTKHTPEHSNQSQLSSFMMWSWTQLRIRWYEWCHSVRFVDVMNPTGKDLYMRTSLRWHLGAGEGPQESTRVRKVDIIRTPKYFRNITRWKRREKQGYENDLLKIWSYKFTHNNNITIFARKKLCIELKLP